MWQIKKQPKTSSTTQPGTLWKWEASGLHAKVMRAGMSSTEVFGQQSCFPLGLKEWNPLSVHTEEFLQPDSRWGEGGGLCGDYLWLRKDWHFTRNCVTLPCVQRNSCLGPSRLYYVRASMCTLWEYTNCTEECWSIIRVKRGIAVADTINILQCWGKSWMGNCSPGMRRYFYWNRWDCLEFSVASKLDNFLNRWDVSLHPHFWSINIQTSFSALLVNRVCKLHGSAIQILGKILSTSVGWKPGIY